MRLRCRAFLVAFAAAAAFSPQTQAQGKSVIVGAAVSQSGFLADLAVGMRNALLLWQEDVNARGGLLGRPVDLRLYDDASEALRSTALYEMLIKDDAAELLIGPFGSAATSIAAAVAERNRRVMVNATGASPAIHKRVYRYLFQVPSPADRSTLGVLPLAEGAGFKAVAVVARDEAAAAPFSVQLKVQAEGRNGGPQLQPAAYYTVDRLKGLAPFAAQLRASGADVVVTPAGVREAADLVRGFKAAGFAPGLFISRASVEPEFIKLLGVDAEYSVGLTAYEPRALTPGNAAFVKAYRAKYKIVPDVHAASGWVAGKVLEAAVTRAGSFEQEKLRDAFAALVTDTLLGGYKVAADGSQIAATPFLVQILKGRREVIWPEAWRSAKAVAPAPEWSRRGLQP